MEKMKTSDLFFGAYLMASGSRLDNVTVDKDNKKKVHFEFSAPTIGKLAHEYLSGEATVNLRYLKSSIKHLRDIIFEKTVE